MVGHSQQAAAQNCPGDCRDLGDRSQVLESCGRQGDGVTRAWYFEFLGVTDCSLSSSTSFDSTGASRLAAGGIPVSIPAAAVAMGALQKARSGNVA